MTLSIDEMFWIEDGPEVKLGIFLNWLLECYYGGLVVCDDSRNALRVIEVMNDVWRPLIGAI